MDVMERYNEWLSNPCFDEDTKKELREIADDEKEITERFYRDLEFGTAGLRGIIGAGTNRMNVYTVRKATQGLANYIISQKKESRGVAIAYDSRHMSPEFADEAALSLAANGIKAYVFESLRPTPELSFAVRTLGTAAGINITASHNPPEYNGYKVYWEDGAQITPPHDKGIMDEVKSVTEYESVKTISKEEAKEKGLYQTIGKDIDDKYMDELKSLIYDKESIEKDDIVIVYTPLYGTGNIPVRRLLKEIGFTKVYAVAEQSEPDGDFPTVSYPNPETKEAFELALRDAKKVGADLVLATDPDADRLGVYVRDKEGSYHCLTGNMSGCLIGEYILSTKKTLPKDGAVIKSIVTTNLLDAIAGHYNVRLIEVLTGFKYIGQKILEFENTGKGTYLFGMEESYGCLPGTYARDKDAVAASMVLCEAAAHYKTLGKTLWDVMTDIYEKYGYYKEDVISITLSGKEGLEKISHIMDCLGEETIDKLGSFSVISKRDYRKGIITESIGGKTSPTNLPKSNVIYYDLEDNAWACVRPSGTEPKIKLYFGAKAKNEESAGSMLQNLKNAINGLVKHYM